MYRVLADGRQLDIPRDRPAQLEVTDGDVVVRWSACDELPAEITARHRIREVDSAVDVTFSATPRSDLGRFEVFISSYFTPYYTPRYAVRDSRLSSDDLAWYGKKWYGEGENEVELYGSEGAITNGEISRYQDGGVRVEPVQELADVAHTEPPDPAPAFYYEIEHFAMAVAGRVEPEVDAGDAYRFMKILDALYDSARSGERVDIP